MTCWEHEDILNAMQTRLDFAPGSMRIRRQTVEHPLRDDQAVDGLRSSLNEDIKARQHRNEPTRVGLQPETGGENNGHQKAVGGYQVLECS